MGRIVNAFWIALITVWAQEAAAASLYQYSYTGRTLTKQGDNLRGPDLLDGFRIDFVVDETKLGKNSTAGASLVNTNFEFIFLNSRAVPPLPCGLGCEVASGTGLASVGQFFDGSAEARILARTDENRQIVDWRVFTTDYQGSVTSSTALDFIDNYYGYPNYTVEYAGKPGSWEVSPVPLPAAFPLLLSAFGALAALGVAARRRSRSLAGSID